MKEILSLIKKYQSGEYSIENISSILSYLSLNSINQLDIKKAEYDIETARHTLDEEKQIKVANTALSRLLNVDIKDGTITYNTFEIDFNVPFSEQLDNMTEDLLQIRYDGDYVLDVGWYPEFDSDGNFKICVIKNDDWDNPLFYEVCRSEVELKRFLNIAVGIISEVK